MKVSELRVLYAKSTQGEWKAQHHNSFECVFDKNGNVVCFPYEYTDSKFIAVSHNAMPELLDTIDALMKRLGHAEQVIKGVRHWLDADDADPVNEWEHGYKAATLTIKALLGDYADAKVPLD